MLKFYSLNIAIRNDDRQRVEKFTDAYSFTKLYTDYNGFQKIGIKGVPHYLVLDEDLMIQYSGPLLTNKKTLYNNFYQVINEIRSGK